MILLFTDFGLEGPYIGQVKAALYANAPDIPVFDLISNAPPHDPTASAYLLATYCQSFPDQSVFLAVVDPGVGGNRRPIVVRAGTQWFIGPDNGLFELVIRRAMADVEAWEIRWQPEFLSSSFHGRDLFAPIAARIAGNQTINGNDPDFKALDVASIRRTDWPDDLAAIIYVDHFGNSMTGLRANQLSAETRLRACGKNIIMAETFTSVSTGDIFCYENSNGLIEIAVNGGRAIDELGAQIGEKVELIHI